MNFYLTVKCQCRFKTLVNMVFLQLQKRFIVKSYFRNGNHESGEWRCCPVACLIKFRQQFPDFVFLETDEIKPDAQNIAFKITLFLFYLFILVYLTS